MTTCVLHITFAEPFVRPREIANGNSYQIMCVSQIEDTENM